ncbi:MAG TPA: two-component regulator propeller domain-containing protein [Candidatus Kapabacteria bacterium]|nr:two-component regulator propeller domain-containing protein [Candidatus Kapabacteria bacterium]
MQTGKKCETQKQLCAFILILLFTWTIEALDPDQPVSQYLIDKWDTGRGLPDNSVTSISQTPDGYLWLATSKGLVRFDGVKFSIIPFFQTNDKLLKKIKPEVIFLDKSDVLWIGAGKSLTAYDYKTGKFKNFTQKDNLRDEKIRWLGGDMGGNLWISFWGNGMARFSKETFTFFDADQGLEGKKINAIIENQKGNLLVGARDKGLFIFKDGKFSRYPIKELENIQVIALLEDRKGNLWIGTTQGLIEVNGSKIKKYTAAGSGLSDDNVRFITEDSEENLWVGTDKGLNRLKHLGDGNIPTIETFLLSTNIIVLFEDREKNLWVGTEGEGLKQIKDSGFISYKPLEPYKDQIIMSLFEAQNKDIWIGTISGKLFHISAWGGVEVLEPRELKGIGINAITEDFERNLWLGTIDNGVFEKKNNIYYHYTTDNGLTDNTIYYIYLDSKQNLWFNTFQGVTVLRYQNRAFEAFTSRDGLAGKEVSSIIEDKNQDIWIGTNHGLTVLKDGKTGGKNICHYLDEDSISCIYEDTQTRGVYWVATNGTGLKRLIIKDKKLISSIAYTTAEGMVTDNIFQFLEDNDNRFWLMSDCGVLRVNKNELQGLAGKESANIYCASFGTTDGMQSSVANNKLSRNSILKTVNGDLWFLTDTGISIVNPEKIRINKTAPPVQIEAIFLNQVKIALYQEPNAYIFKGNSDFTVHFTAPTFLSPEKIKFKYRLEGFDKDWLTLAAGKERTAFYKNLGPGKYVFKVTACNADGVWNQAGDAIAITIKPYFHQTIFFKMILFLLMALPSAAGYYLYKKHLLKKNNTEEKKKYQGSLLDSKIADDCVVKLKHLIEVKKVYRDEEISLQTLAQMVPTTPHILSQVLNEKLNHNFSDFINSYRVEEAVKILASPGGKDKKNWIVAHDVGFNNMGVFYKAFKKYTGMTPTQYKRKTK